MLLSGSTRVLQPERVIFKISNALISLRSWIPSDFARKPRSLKFVKRFKATEWRLLLLYIGVIVLSCLPKHLYEHFLVLHVAIKILCCTDLLEKHLDYAKDLLLYFVKSFSKLYGSQHVTHNIHNMIHLADECARHGTLDSFSAFKFENFYQFLKKLLRKGEKPLQQLSRRYEEKKLKYVKSKIDSSGCLLSGRHTDGPLPASCMNPQYSSYQCNGKFSLGLQQAENCCFLQDGSIVVVDNFATDRKSKGTAVIGRKFLSQKSLFSFPCDSSLLDTFHVSNLSESMCWSLEDIKSKCVRLPYNEGFAVFPLLH
ncbi:hypothetical protein ONE63_002456 [Megalurothrips usitatus]|uniref:Uncharacterized protein n=1 Tax=Megalurothrips usitatus TaxID=439358 RepID=A0AAV7X880_9NEOP|nr:hypothetical protein ONE63_002456 [Megalurothrips usitatus]